MRHRTGTGPQVAYGQLALAVDSLGRALVEDQPGAAVVGLLREDMTAVPAFGAVDATGCPTMARTLFGVGSIAKAFTRLFLADATEQGDVAGTHTPSVGRLGSLSHRLRLVRDAARWAPWWHNGGIGGFRSMVALDRTAGYGVVVLANVVLAPAKRIVSA